VAKAQTVPGVSAETPIGQFAARVIETRANEVTALAAKRSNGSMRGVHDRRVALRRLRSALEVFETTLPKHGRRVRKDVKAVFSVLGPRRDADVALELVRGFEPSLARDDLPGWRAVIAALEAEREASPAALDRDAALSAGEAATELAAKAGARDGAAAAMALREVIGPRLGVVRGDLDALDDPKDAEALHRLRIDAKRLRYTLEAAEPALGAPAAAGAKAARELQTVLGDIHDCDVLLPWLRRRRRALRSADVAAVGQGRRAPNAARYRGLQTVDTLVRARRAALAEQAVAQRPDIAAALDRARDDLGIGG
jgi:CHAD domain-containing protein